MEGFQGQSGAAGEGRALRSGTEGTAGVISSMGGVIEMLRLQPPSLSML